MNGGYGTYSTASNGTSWNQIWDGSSSTSGQGYWTDPYYQNGGAWSSPNSVPPTYSRTPADELKSPPKDEKEKEGHILSGTLKIYGDTVVVEYYCSHCNKILYKQVISKVPEKIRDAKCLPRLVKDVQPI